jgi:hypothetical protein
MDLRKIANLQIGEKIQYFKGCLASERVENKDLDRLADFLYDASTQADGSGEFELTQEKEKTQVYRYFVRRLKFAREQ